MLEAAYQRNLENNVQCFLLQCYPKIWFFLHSWLIDLLVVPEGLGGRVFGPEDEGDKPGGTSRVERGE